jgi:hypothetical protein
MAVRPPPQVVNTLGSLGRAVRHRHAAIHPTTHLAQGCARALGLRNTLRGWGRKHTLVTITWWSAFSAPSAPLA